MCLRHIRLLFPENGSLWVAWHRHYHLQTSCFWVHTVQTQNFFHWKSLFNLKTIGSEVHQVSCGKWSVGKILLWHLDTTWPADKCFRIDLTETPPHSLQQQQRASVGSCPPLELIKRLLSTGTSLRYHSLVLLSRNIVTLWTQIVLIVLTFPRLIHGMSWGKEKMLKLWWMQFGIKETLISHVQNCARRESGGDVRPSELPKNRRLIGD